VRMDALTSPAHRDDATEAGAVLGTIAYMRLNRPSANLWTKRADIWAFGCVLYELVTGRQAFTGEAASGEQTRFLRRVPNGRRCPLKRQHRSAGSATLSAARSTAPVRDIGDALIELEDPAEADVVSRQEGVRAASRGWRDSRPRGHRAGRSTPSLLVSERSAISAPSAPAELCHPGSVRGGRSRASIRPR
jgi:serine/threonine protein kinase